MCIRDRNIINKLGFSIGYVVIVEDISKTIENERLINWVSVCLLYTSDAADERSSVDLGGRRIIKKKKIV